MTPITYPLQLVRLLPRDEGLEHAVEVHRRLGDLLLLQRAQDLHGLAVVPALRRHLQVRRQLGRHVRRGAAVLTEERLRVEGARHCLSPARGHCQGRRGGFSAPDEAQHGLRGASRGKRHIVMYHNGVS